MKIRQRMPSRLALVAIAAGALWMGLVPAASAKPPKVRFKVMHGFQSPGTPANLNMVGILKTGPEQGEERPRPQPGASASAAYFNPLAKSIVRR